MIYCQGYTISMTEVPDEVALTLQIGECPFRCEGCHSPELREARGFDLEKELPYILQQYKDSFTVVCFMGEGQDFDCLARCCKEIQEKNPKYKLCVYSGDDTMNTLDQLEHRGVELDYFKYGSYQPLFGGLDSLNTNQIFLKKAMPNYWVIETQKFYKRKKASEK